MLPLVLALLGLYDMSEVSTADLRQIDSVRNKRINPVLVILKGKIQDEPPRVGMILL